MSLPTTSTTSTTPTPEEAQPLIKDILEILLKYFLGTMDCIIFEEVKHLIPEELHKTVIDLCGVIVQIERHCHCGREGTPKCDTEVEEKTLKSETGKEISVSVEICHEWLSYSWGTASCDHSGCDYVQMIHKEYILGF